MSVEELPTTLDRFENDMRPEIHAAHIIREVTNEEAQHGSVTPDRVAIAIERSAERTPQSVRQIIQEYVTALRKLSRGVIAPLPAGVGGQYDGSGIEIAVQTIQVEDNVQKTIARMRETMDHERYHADSHHEKTLLGGASAGGSAIVEIGKTRFPHVALIEGLTVHDTGHQFVSLEYRQYMQNLLAAVAASDISIDDVRVAVNEKKNLAPIDDAVSDNLLLLHPF